MNEQEQQQLRQVGTLAGIMEKTGGWHEIHINTGGQYELKLSTKLQPLIELARAAGTEQMVWRYTEKDSGNPNPHQPGKNFINRYFQGVEPVGEASTETATVGPPASPAPSSDAMSKEEWRAKDDAIHYMACIKTAAAALTHTMPSEPSNEDLNKFLERTWWLAHAWHRTVLAKRDDPAGEGIPF